ncbi:MAG: hypothetical protein ACTSQI_06715 [Candidatus Helarchaeota archaeon]
MIQEPPFDKFHVDLFHWLQLIEQARKNIDGDIVHSFLEIIKLISTELDPLFSPEIDGIAIKSIFIGILIIQYLNKRYAIEKVMLYVKGRCHASDVSPSAQIQTLLARLQKILSAKKLPPWDKSLANALFFILNRDFKTARAALTSENNYFIRESSSMHLSFLEMIVSALLKKTLADQTNEIIDAHLQKFITSPYSLYFSILRNLLHEIQAFHDQRRGGLKFLKALFDDLHQIKQIGQAK